MSDALLDKLRDAIQQDVNQRGLAGDLFEACRDDFAKVCRDMARTPQPHLAVVTGFFIPHAEPPCGETDGPLGALFLARAFVHLGIQITIISDTFCRLPIEAGLRACDCFDTVPLVILSPRGDSLRNPPMSLTHLLALERVGPGRDGHCRNMRGRDVTDETAPAHLLFERKTETHPITIGIGDGGNEIGMGKIPQDTIARNVPLGERIACSVATDYLIVAGVSNWGAYALAAGVAVLRGRRLPAALFEVEGERDLLRRMVEEGPLVDGVSGRQTVTVDGLDFEKYAEPLQRIGELLEKEQWLI